MSRCDMRRGNKKTETLWVKVNPEGIFMWLKFSTIITGEADANFYGQFPHTCTPTPPNLPQQNVKFLHVVLLYRTGRKDEKRNKRRKENMKVSTVNTKDEGLSA